MQLQTTQTTQTTEIYYSDLGRINEVITAFIEAQDIKHNSAELYARSLRQFFKWVSESNLVISQLAHIDLLNYKNSLLQAGKSSLTVGNYVTAIRKFYEWAEANKYYVNIAKSIKNPRRTQSFRKQPLTNTQCTELINNAKTNGVRDYALISLMLRTGLRTIEIIRANRQDLKVYNGVRVLWVHGKGRDEKDNFVIISDKVYTPLMEYLKTRPNVSENEPLFISESNNSKGERLTTRTIRQIVKKNLIEIGLNEKYFTAHSLRHTTAVSILRAGGTIENAQGVLRHSTPATTQIYTHTIKEEQRLKNATELMLDTQF